MNVNKKSKSLKYVETYDNIIDIINKYNLKPGDTIPSETKLSLEFNVSRGTVRQAIALLKEDGIIYNHQGKGNIILDKQKSSQVGLENVTVPIFAFNNMDYTKVDLTIEFQPASSKMKEFLEIDDNFMVMLINVKYYIGKDICALLMYFINYEDIKEYDLNVKDEKDLKKLIDEFILNNVVKSELSFQSFFARESIAKKMSIEIGAPIIYFSEIMRKNDDRVSIYRRSYFRPNYFTFKLNRVLK